MNFKKIASILTLLLINSVNAYAFELVIEDSLGNIRHVSEVSGKANVKMSVSDPSGNAVNGTVITITLKDGYSASEIPQSDKIKQATTEAGIAMFKDVNPGRWTMTAGSDSLVLAEIDVLDPDSMRASLDTAASGSTSTGVLSGISTTTLLVGGTTVIVGTTAIATDGFSSNSSDEPSPFE